MRPSLSSSGRVHSLTGGLHHLKDSIRNASIIRDTLAARREKEILETNYAKRPLTHRNVESHLEAQRIDDACNPQRSSRQVQISEWIHVISSVGVVVLHGDRALSTDHMLRRKKNIDVGTTATIIYVSFKFLNQSNQWKLMRFGGLLENLPPIGQAQWFPLLSCVAVNTIL